MPLSKKQIGLASFGVAIVLLGGLMAAAMYFQPGEQQRIEREIAKAGYCSVAADCEVLYAPCPFGCSVGVNRAESARITALMASYPSTCQYMCIATTGVDCVSNRCVVQFEQPPIFDGEMPPQEPEPSSTETFTDADLGLTFTYKTGAGGYVLVRPPEGNIGDVSAIVLFTKEGYDAMQNAPVPSEGPPTINVVVAPALGLISPQAWLDTNQQVVGSITSPPEPAVIGGQPGLRWGGDGLYSTDAAMTIFGDKAYVFTAGWVDANSPMRTDFTAMLESVRFSAAAAPAP